MIIFCGDIHGNWKYLIDKIRMYKMENAHIILCGDIGIGFKNNPEKEIKELEYWSVPLSKNNNMIYAVRGNHDDPAFFDGNHNASNIKLIKDYTVLEIEDQNILCIGGATSIDRVQRREGTTYWKDEQPVYNEEILSNTYGIDIVASHTAPSLVYPHTKEGISWWMSHDEHLESDLNYERATMDKIYTKLKEYNCVKDWYYGHFHSSYHGQRLDGTQFHLLGINEFKEHYTDLPLNEY